MDFWRNSGFIALVILFLAGGCGFQPLYGKGGDGDEDIRLTLQRVEIASIPNREGQILHNLLLDRLNPRGRATKPSYTLKSTISISTSSLGVSRDDTTTREKLIVSVNFVLSSKSGEDKTFSIRRVSGYSQTESEYATLEAKNDAIRRSLREIASDARARVAAYLRTDSGLKGG